jgi:BirA family biotin operon repressor/biotin-[acetyl-CoA-carboxylase] ligase
VSVVEETVSTNADLLQAARDGAPHGTVLVADHQTAGRGRQGRTWSAPPGSGLLCSVLLRPGRDAVLAGATWSVGLAARAACAETAGVTPDLKWPNDLLVGPRKLAGVLAESVAASGAVAAVVVGLGLNVRWTAPPPDEVAARAISLSEAAGRAIPRDALLRAFLAALAPLLDEWRDAPDRLLARYRAGLATLGRRVRVATAQGELVGTARDVAGDGALLVVDEDGTVHALHAGDVVHLRDHGSEGSPR